MSGKQERGMADCEGGENKESDVCHHKDETQQNITEIIQAMRTKGTSAFTVTLQEATKRKERNE